MKIDAAKRLIVAIDVPHDLDNPTRIITEADANFIIKELEDLVSFFKVGWPLYLSEEHIADKLIDQGKKVFLDLKYGDIPETIKRLVTKSASSKIDFLTINGSTDVLRAAAEGRNAIKSSSLKILRVTLLTCMGESDLAESGFDISTEDYVTKMAILGKDAGCDGVICSGQEVAAIRKAIGKDFLIVTPGIRPSGFSVDDHKRYTTPREAILAGADYLVMGRPIMRSADPHATVKQVIEEMQDAFNSIEE